MAETTRLPVFGSQPPCAKPSRQMELTGERKLDLELTEELCEFPENVYYDSSDDEYTPWSMHKALRTSYNVVDFIRNREYGLREYRTFNKYHCIRHLLKNNILSEKQIPLKTTSKVISSQWLNCKEIIFGTENNELMIYNVNSRICRQIPSIKSRKDIGTDKRGSINVIQINTSRSLLLTSAYGFDELGVYELPTLEPICITKGPFKKNISDAVWIDDNCFVSTSKDKKVVLWNIQDKCEIQYDETKPVPTVKQFITPSVIQNCKTKQEVEKMVFIKQSQSLVTVSLDKFVTVWDMEHFKPKFSYKLIVNTTNGVYIAKNNSGYLCVVGYNSDFKLVDSRALHTLKTFNIKDKHGIKSLSLVDNIITVGTGVGLLRFFDIRTGRKLLKSQISPRSTLKTSLINPNLGMQLPADALTKRYKPAIFTHCYDDSGTKLFTAGGPIIDTPGSYASFWL